MNRFTRLFASCAVAAAACGAASATPIAAGGSVSASLVVPGAITVLGTYNNVAFTSYAPAGLASTFSGTYTSSVFRDTNNTLCGVAGQCLTFGIQVNNNSTSTDGIETVTTGPFSSLFTYNVGYNNANGGKAPIVINHSASGAMQFDFRNVGSTANVIAPGQFSDFLLIQSSALDYTMGNVSFQDNQTATVAGFIPSVGTSTSVTPEPSSLILLGTGLLGAASTTLRRRKLSA